jgi:hypothetical protein
MNVIEGRYNWDDGVDPTRAEYLTGNSSVSYLADGETAIAYIGLYDADLNYLGDVGLWVDDLPSGVDTVYRVEVVDRRIVDIEHGSAVVEAWKRAKRMTED